MSGKFVNPVHTNCCSKVAQQVPEYTTAQCTVHTLLHIRNNPQSSSVEKRETPLKCSSPFQVGRDNMTLEQKTEPQFYTLVSVIILWDISYQRVKWECSILHQNVIKSNKKH